MSEFRIFETERFQEDLRQYLGPSEEKLVRKLRTFVYPRLRQQPYFGKNIKKLRGYRPETWRYRIGEYRFFYEVDDRQKIIFMIAAELRSKSY